MYKNPDMIKLVITYKKETLNCLINRFTTVSELINLIRKKWRISKYKSLFFFCNRSVLMSGNYMICFYYDKYKDAKNRLEIEVYEELTFGSPN